MKSSRFIYLAYNFWNVVQLLVEQMEQRGNKIGMCVDYDSIIDHKEHERQFNDMMKRNDNNIGVPIMFNFYHGLELFMKGLLELEYITLDKSDHNLQDLYKLIKANESKYTSSLIQLLKGQIFNSNSFNPFFKSNNVKINDFYIGLKYPQDKSGTKKYDYYMIRGKEEETLKIYQTMRDATLDFKEEVRLWITTIK